MEVGPWLSRSGPNDLYTKSDSYATLPRVHVYYYVASVVFGVHIWAVMQGKALTLSRKQSEVGWGMRHA